jgi:nitroreductase
MAENRQATPNHPIHELIAKRWSPYSFTDQAVSEADLKSLFEAAGWAASSFNEQPWSYVVAARSDSTEFERILSCLVEANQVWAAKAPVLALGVIKTTFTHNDTPNRVALHDLGAASASLTFEATARSLVVHQMAGIDPNRARELYDISDGYEVVTALAIGYAGDPNLLPDGYKERDLAPRTRRSLAEFVFTGKWRTASTLLD